ncbi:hypothetical protein GE061_007117 [Apolygus lucorum]|uniref:Peptidase S1 domain-containing protein n=1 Tax=Apolygus lucorum TaxID=248454 RepID=A0A8S9WQT6_APOLU|nr:hypothetical protein GE061_007117 [Apolygus lucorum]
MQNSIYMGLLIAVGFKVSYESGLSGRNETQRIAENTGFEVSSAAEAPFTVVLVVATGKYFSERPFCTGIIIDPKFVLTAAHCAEALDKIHAQRSYGEIHAGVSKLLEVHQRGSEFQVRTISTRNIKIHPRFFPSWWEYLHPSPSKYDVALIEVDEPFKFNDKVNQTQLWDEEWPRAVLEGKHEYGIMDCMAYGWGLLSYSPQVKPSQGLRKVQVLAKHGIGACPGFLNFQQRRVVCSQSPSICPGDSGGPLVCRNKTVGVAHILYPFIFDCTSDFIMTAWMYVCPMLDFIHEHVPSVPAPPISCESPHLTLLPVALISLVHLFISKLNTENYHSSHCIQA